MFQTWVSCYLKDGNKMGCWIAFCGKSDNFSRRIRRFRKVFSVDGVPRLTTIIMNHDRFFRSVLWAWRNNGVPDVNVRSDGDGNVVILCGAVTDLGRYGSVSSDPNETAKNIMHLWKEHRDSIIDQINGSWSFVFYNAKDQSVVAFTDRFASRSVWISRDGNVWIIGNFPSAVVTLRKNSTTIDPAGLWSLFQTSRHIPGRGLYSQVFSLIAGQKVVLKSDGDYGISNWYKRRYKPDYTRSPREWGYRLANALKCSAALYKRITPHPYLFLSGGLDSRIAAAAIGRPLKNITLFTKPNTELRITDFVSFFLGLKHFRIKQSDYWYYLKTIDAAALISSGNYNIAHAHFIVPTINIAGHSSNVAFLLGDLLENLNKHYSHLQKDKRLTFSPDKFPYVLNTYDRYTTQNLNRLMRIFNFDFAAHLQRYWIEEIQKIAKSITNVSEDDADRFDTYFRWIDVSVTPTYNMITCIWPFASERNIFFNNELNDLSLQIPSSIRGTGIIHRWILWYLNRWLLFIPDANNFLPVFFPKHLQKIAKEIRPKLGRLRRNLYSKAKPSQFLPSSGCWPLLYELYRKDIHYRMAIECLFNDGRAFPGDIFNIVEIRMIWDEFLQGDNSLMFDINMLISFGSLNRLIPIQGIQI